MADDIRALSAELARNPASLVFLTIAETLRRRGQLSAAERIAVTGLERHPHLADAHDVFARILVDLGHAERAQDEWSMALRLEPRHVGALKGLGFLAYRDGDLDEALERLETALSVDPTDERVVQALRTVRNAAEAGGVGPAERDLRTGTPRVDRATGAFSGFEGAEHGILLVDIRGRVLAGGLRAGRNDVAEEVATYLAGASQEAERTARLLGLGAWAWIVAEGPEGNLHVSVPADETLLLVKRDRSVPSGRLAIVAARAAGAARAWLADEADRA